jgi:hypothetical protein
MSFNLIKIAFLTISNVLMQLRDKFTKIKINNYYFVNASKVNITIYVVRLIKDFCLKFLK